MADAIALSGGALGVGPAGLTLDGASIADLAGQHGTPLYVYGADTILRRFAALREALGGVGRPYAIRFAMKSNRFGPVLDLVRAEGDIRIDTCSPREVERATQHGFSPDEISLTAGMLSNRDLALIGRAGVKPNLDTFSVIRRWAAAPDRKTATIGLRINPEVVVGWGETDRHAYGNSKFGFDQDAVAEAVALAESLGLVVDEVHMHLGWGLQRSAEPAMRRAFEGLAAIAGAIPTVKTVNVGGGLCWPQRPEDDPMPVGMWAQVVGDSLAKLPPDVKIACEPGTFIMGAAGVLVLEVTTVETRKSGLWYGVDGGHAINVFAAHYAIPMARLPVAEPRRPLTTRANLGGNINEANDVFARDAMMPALTEGELLALYPAGAYGSSMASDHCLRGAFVELLVP